MEGSSARIPKRRTWRKLHLAMDERSGEILANVATTNDVGDKGVLGIYSIKWTDKITTVTAVGGL